MTSELPVTIIFVAFSWLIMRPRLSSDIQKNINGSNEEDDYIVQEPFSKSKEFCERETPNRVLVERSTPLCTDDYSFTEVQIDSKSLQDLAETDRALCHSSDDRIKAHPPNLCHESMLPHAATKPKGELIHLMDDGRKIEHPQSIKNASRSTSVTEELS
jgi:hypothetical protein